MASGDFRQQPHSRARGRTGEDAGALWLSDQGYSLVERNFSCKAGEIDVIAREGETLCFVEIKARATATYGSAIDAISHVKQRRISRAAAFYLTLRPFEGPCRFDVLAMDLEAAGWRFTLVRDAFMASG